MDKIKLEASYFFEVDGKRKFGFVVDKQNSDQMPMFAEPLFQWGAEVEFHPVMSFDDLKKAVSRFK